MKSRPWWVYVAFMSFLLGAQFLIARHQLPSKTGNAEVKAAIGRFFAVVPPLNSASKSQEAAALRRAQQAAE